MDRARSVLADHAVGAGDRIALSLDTTPQFLIWALAALERGAAVVPVYSSAPPAEFADRCAIGKVAAAVVEDDALPRRQREFAGVTGTPILLAESAWQQGAPRPPATGGKASGDDLAFLHFSSGTTGEPKVIPLTHKNILAGRLLFAQATCLDDRSVLVHFLPLVHIYGWMAATVALAAGGTVILHRRYDFDALVRDTEAYRATAIFGLPQAILDFAAQDGSIRPRIETLRFLNTGSAPLAPEIMRAVVVRYGLTVTTGYGLTEAAPVSHTSVDRPDLIDPITVGYPVANTEIRLVDPADSSKSAPSAGPGELLVAGPQVAHGYLEADGTLVRTAWIGDRWLRTGDLVELDALGRLRIVGRLKNIVKYKGYSVVPGELEAILAQHPAVADCAVVGRPDPVAGEVPTAFVVRRAGSRVGPDELINFVRARVAPQRRLRAVVIVDKIPRSGAGKILTEQLLAQHSGPLSKGGC